MQLTSALAMLLAAVPLVAAKDSRTFAVLHFHGNGPLTRGRSDPIVNPGEYSSHVHTVQGGNAFGNSATGESMRTSTCSTADVAADLSAYWMPSLYFHDTTNDTFEPVDLFYMNVYYFFEATNDNITAFPVGLQMVSGDATKKTPPATGDDVLDPSQGTIQPAQFTCPRSSYDPASYPADSDGTMAGIQDTNNEGAGAGFPFAECDGYASPLRADLHFPSCYNPSAGLTSYKENMQFPTDAGDGKQDCPEGWTHTPHIFFEMYWNTPLFIDRWTPNDGYQPFVLSNGDAAGYSLHGDFLSGWNETVLQHIIDTCDAGDAGMDQCEGIETVLEGDCSIDNPSPETIDGSLAALPGSNPLFGWQYGTGSAATTAAASAGTTASSTVSSASAASSAAFSASAASSSASSSAASSAASVATSSIAASAASASSAADGVVEAAVVSSFPSSTATAAAVSGKSSSSASSSALSSAALGTGTGASSYANHTSTTVVVLSSVTSKASSFSSHYYANSSTHATATATADASVVVGAAASDATSEATAEATVASTAAADASAAPVVAAAAEESSSGACGAATVTYTPYVTVTVYQTAQTTLATSSKASLSTTKVVTTKTTTQTSTQHQTTVVTATGSAGTLVASAAGNSTSFTDPIVKRVEHVRRHKHHHF